MIPRVFHTLYISNTQRHIQLFSETQGFVQHHQNFVDSMLNIAAIYQFPNDSGLLGLSPIQPSVPQMWLVSSQVWWVGSMLAMDTIKNKVNIGLADAHNA